MKEPLRSSNNDKFNQWLDKLPTPYDLDEVEKIHSSWHDKIQLWESKQSLKSEIKNDKKP